MKIAITGHASISSLGSIYEAITESIYSENSFIKNIDGNWVAPIFEDSNAILLKLKEEKAYKNLDKTSLMAIAVARTLKSKIKDKTAVNVGSSRGATETWEKHYDTFLTHPSNKVSSYASPHTTLGNISSWVAQDIGSSGLSFSHSITCSTALHSLANAVAWLESGMATSFLAGGSEAPLTPFTIKQMRALGIYSKEIEGMACMPFNGDRNTMVLGEGAALFLLEKDKKAPYYIKSIGYATEQINSAAGISDDGKCLYDSMKMALDGCEEKVDFCILHAPGTIKGDGAELKALNLIFKDNPPAYWSNKWKIGHTLGASGALSLSCALHILEQQNIQKMSQVYGNVSSNNVKNILINAVGFGGNAVSLIVGV